MAHIMFDKIKNYSCANIHAHGIQESLNVP